METITIKRLKAQVERMKDFREQQERRAHLLRKIIYNLLPAEQRSVNGICGLLRGAMEPGVDEDYDDVLLLCFFDWEGCLINPDSRRAPQLRVIDGGAAMDHRAPRA
jgi:hypothetical protein